MVFPLMEAHPTLRKSRLLPVRLLLFRINYLPQSLAKEREEPPAPLMDVGVVTGMGCGVWTKRNPHNGPQLRLHGPSPKTLAFF